MKKKISIPASKQRISFLKKLKTKMPEIVGKYVKYLGKTSQGTDYLLWKCNKCSHLDKHGFGQPFELYDEFYCFRCQNPRDQPHKMRPEPFLIYGTISGIPDMIKNIDLYSAKAYTNKNHHCGCASCAKIRK